MVNKNYFGFLVILLEALKGQPDLPKILCPGTEVDMGTLLGYMRELEQLDIPDASQRQGDELAKIVAQILEKRIQAWKDLFAALPDVYLDEPLSGETIRARFSLFPSNDYHGYLVCNPDGTACFSVDIEKEEERNFYKGPLYINDDWETVYETLVEQQRMYYSIPDLPPSASDTALGLLLDQLKNIQTMAESLAQTVNRVGHEGFKHYFDWGDCQGQAETLAANIKTILTMHQSRD